jgi:hypothetical protein
MLIKIACRCGHVGVVNAQSLPRERRCWQCGCCRRVEAKDCEARIRSEAVFMEWVFGKSKPPSP